MDIENSPFYNFIGLRDAHEDADFKPASGLWVNTLPGISSELVARISPGLGQELADFWRDVQTLAIEEFRQQVITLMEEKINFHEVAYQTSMPIINGKSIAAANEKRGVYVRLPKDRYVEFYLKNLYIHSLNETTTSIHVYDIRLEKELFKIENVDLTPGLNIISIDEVFLMNQGLTELFIYLAADNLESKLFSYESLFWMDKNRECLSTCVWRGDQPLVVSPRKEIDGVYWDLMQAEGIWLDAQVNCSVDAFLAENKKHFARPLWYLMGAKILEYKLATPRLNFFSTTNLEYTKENLKYRTKDFNESLRTKIATISIGGNSLCLDCDDKQSLSYGGQVP